MPEQNNISKQIQSLLAGGWQNQTVDLDTQIHNLLTAGLTILKLEIAIVSQIEPPTYTVEHCVGGGLEKGQQFDLGKTYCSITTNHRNVVAIHHMNRSDHARHPCYEAFKLESYIGVPVFYQGQLYGTVNFSSATPRSQPFGTQDHIMVQLIAESVNWSLTICSSISVNQPVS